MKKTILLATGALSAMMLVAPAVASAQSAHLNMTPAFTVLGGGSELSREDGGGTTGATTTGTGKFDTTTTGTVKLTFHHVTSSLGTICTTAGQSSGTVTTTVLPFHLVTISGKPYILITPAAGGDHLATFNCGFLIGNIVVRGNGVLGEVTIPGCGQPSNTAFLRFSGAGGVQNPKLYTGTEYTLESSLFGSFSNSAMNATATITFAGGVSPTLTCT